MDGRYKSAKLSDRMLLDSFLSMSNPNACIEALQRDEDPALQWPGDFRPFVTYCLWHRVSREINEPLVEAKYAENGNPSRIWPEFLHQYNKTATLEDMPPLPSPSALHENFERFLKKHGKLAQAAPDEYLAYRRTA